MEADKENKEITKYSEYLQLVIDYSNNYKRDFYTVWICNVMDDIVRDCKIDYPSYFPQKLKKLISEKIDETSEGTTLNSYMEKLYPDINCFDARILWLEKLKQEAEKEEENHGN